MKYVDLPIPELYDLAADPREQRNLADLQPRHVGELQAVLAPFLSADRGGRRTRETAGTGATGRPAPTWSSSS